MLHVILYLIYTADSNEQSVDGISTSENLLDVGPQAAILENGFNGNWWGYPLPPMNQAQHGKV